MRKWVFVALVAGVLGGGSVVAQEAEQAAPPLPLHQIEGSGGVVLTETAWLVNPGTGDEWFGLPAVSASYLVASDKKLSVAAISETLFQRLELSYAFHHLDLGDFVSVANAVEVRGAGEDGGSSHPYHVSHDYIYMHNLNARLLLVGEGEFDQDWLPAITFGVHYKKNIRFDQLDRDLNGALTGAGADDDDGFEYTLVGTKTFKGLLPRPFFVSAGVRATEAAQLGWLGFTNHYAFVLEGNVGVFVLDNLIVGAEYRQKHDALHSIDGLVGKEQGWWSVAAAGVVNENVTLSAAIADLGRLLEDKEPGALWVQLKLEM